MIRIFDFLFSLIGLIILSPLLIFIFLIGLFDNGSPLFIQKRVGYNLRSFFIIKFRTMPEGVRSAGTHLIKNIKLSSFGYIEGLYGLYPRVDKELIKTYSEGVIALSGGLAGEIPNLILNVGEHQAEDALKWWKEVFGDRFYIEINRHGLDEENHLNEVLVKLARKYEVKLIATNELFYLEKD